MGYVEFPFVTNCNVSFSTCHCGSILHRDKEIYLSPRHPGRFWGLFNLLFNPYGGLFATGVKWPGRKSDHWTQVWLELYAHCPIYLLGGHRGESWPVPFTSKVELKERKNIPVQRLATWCVLQGVLDHGVYWQNSWYYCILFLIPLLFSFMR